MQLNPFKNSFEEFSVSDKFILSITTLIFLLIFYFIGKWLGKKITNTTIKLTLYFILFIIGALMYIFLENRIITLSLFNSIMGFSSGFWRKKPTTILKK